jgi:hypothetical protein
VKESGSGAEVERLAHAGEYAGLDQAAGRGGILEVDVALRGEGEGGGCKGAGGRLRWLECGGRWRGRGCGRAVNQDRLARRMAAGAVANAPSRSAPPRRRGARR